MTILLLVKKAFVIFALIVGFISVGFVSDEDYQNAVITPGDQMIIDFFNEWNHL